MVANNSNNTGISTASEFVNPATVLGTVLVNGVTGNNLKINSDGSINVNVDGSAGQPTPVQGYGVSTQQLKASAGTLFSAYMSNRKASSPRYLQIWSGPVGSGTLLFSFLVPYGGVPLAIGTDFFTAAGIAVATSINLAASTTAGTYTAGTASDSDLGGIIQ